jgi:hypothetical protein
MDENLTIEEKDPKILEEYENYPNNNNRIYKDIYELIEYNPTVTYGDKIIIYFVNWPCGLGSALTTFLQNAYYLKQVNKKLIMLRYFCKNTELFKYHEESYNNSFFLYFKYKKQNAITSMKDYSIFFVKSWHLGNLPGVVSKFPMKDENTLNYLRHFVDNFEIRIGENIREYITKIKNSSSPPKPLIGIHIRSIIQKIIGCPDYLKTSINDRINQIKEKLDKEYNNNYTLFIATDVELYVIKCIETFGYPNIKYLNFINRIFNEHDSIPQLERYKGFKLGSDILYECLALSLCDKVYVSNSNIPFMIYMLNPLVPMEEY